MRLPSRVDISNVRAWMITLLGSALVIVGLIKSDSQLIFIGFSSLGVEPLIRAHEDGEL
jgi:hypothetical protein